MCDVYVSVYIRFNHGCKNVELLGSIINMYLSIHTYTYTYILLFNLLQNPRHYTDQNALIDIPPLF